MQFYDYQSLYNQDKKLQRHNISSDLWYREHLSRSDIYGSIPGGRWLYKQIIAEYDWIRLNKPFYNVWPCIVDGLSKVKLNLNCKDIVEPLLKFPQTVLLRLSKSGNFSVQDNQLQVILAHRNILQGQPGLELFCNFGEIAYDNPVFWNLSFNLQNDTVENVIDNLVMNPLASHELDATKTALRILLGVGMLVDDEDLIDNIVLQKDLLKYKETKDSKYIDKAKRRGLFGFNVGASIEVSPHFRHPHFAIRWMGKGRTIPKLRPIKGCIVRRNKLTEVPTGFEDDA